MALQSPFFGKREADAHPPRTTSAVHNTRNASSTPSHTMHTSGAVALPEAAPSPEKSEKDSTASHRPGADSLLKVGPLIRLKGVEITDCDTLFVEGTVEATMDSRVMEIAPPGRFKGAAEIDIAEIHGHFDGSLTVRERLVIHPTGRVTGTVRYGKLSIAEGGQLSGDIGVLSEAVATLKFTQPTTTKIEV